ncbi:unnamed protein product [Paramecium octaurelia]|uniref:Protein kinase domain-containing protein n=1 Tax=Paramecium octaurelia TaxID=43137 RepID=A0A8S1V2E9_PAROT|nr:unnamed protein product [Paramecium octaurelia]
MGNNNSQESTKLAQLYSEYQPTKTRDEQFGDCTVLVNKSNSKVKLILKEYTYTDETLFKKNKKQFENKQQLIQNQYILKILDIYTTQDQQVCSQFFKIYVLIEHPTSQLSATQLSSQDYWAVLFGYVRALEDLQNKSISHEHISSKTLYLPPKICDPTLYEQSTNFQQLFQNNKLTDLFLSPQQTMALRQKEFQPQHNPYKSDVFTLGMCILQSILRTPIVDCYKQLYLVEEVLLTKLHQLNTLVQPQLFEVIQSMLSIQETQRPDFVVLSKLLDQKYQEQASITNFKYQLRSFNSQDQQQCSNSQNSQHQSNVQNQQQTLPIIKQIKSSKSNTNAKKPSLREIITEQSNTNSTMASRMQEDGVQPSQPDNSDFVQQVIYSQQISKPSKIDENIDNTENDENFTDRSSSLPLQDHTDQHVNKNFQLKLSNINVKESQQQFSIPFDLPQQQPQPHISGFSSQGEIFVNEQYQDGSKYNGYKFNGMRHGQGIFYYKDGGYYDGNWQFNHMHGYGTLYYSNGQPAYKGSWNQDKFQGYGVLYNEMASQLNEPFNYQDFDHIEDFWTKYEGEFNDDNKEGQGTLYLSNGEKFCGQFLKDYINGFGLFHTKNQKIVEGRWVNNKLIK